MINGVIRRNGKEAVLALEVRGPTGRTLRLEGILDTGFTDFLTLPNDEIDGLNLPWMTQVDAKLADGSLSTTDVYEANVKWDGETKLILVAAVNTTPLIGMSLMQGFRFTMDVIPDGKLQLERMPSA